MTSARSGWGECGRHARRRGAHALGGQPRWGGDARGRPRLGLRLGWGWWGRGGEDGGCPARRGGWRAPRASSRPGPEAACARSRPASGSRSPLGRQTVARAAAAGGLGGPERLSGVGWAAGCELASWNSGSREGKDGQTGAPAAFRRCKRSWVTWLARPDSGTGTLLGKSPKVEAHTRSFPTQRMESLPLPTSSM